MKEKQIGRFKDVLPMATRTARFSPLAIIL
jgi:hypothetical protein